MKTIVFFIFVLITLAASCPNFESNLKMFCKYGGENEPCTVKDYSSLRADCCAMPGRCKYTEFPKDKVCCFTQDCLNRCYPGKRYQIGTVY